MRILLSDQALMFRILSVFSQGQSEVPSGMQHYTCNLSSISKSSASVQKMQNIQ